MHLAMDGVLCDYALPMFGDDANYVLPNIGGGGNVKRNGAKMNNRAMTMEETQRHARKLVRRLLGQDSVLDNETAEKLKGFLKNKLSAEDHEQVCNMLAGDVEAEDTEPPPGGTEPPAKFKGAAADAQADFLRRYPGLAKVRVDNSGIQPPARAASYSADGAASFAAMFPDAMKIRIF